MVLNLGVNFSPQEGKSSVNQSEGGGVSGRIRFETTDFTPYNIVLFMNIRKYVSCLEDVRNLGPYSVRRLNSRP